MCRLPNDGNLLIIQHHLLADEQLITFILRTVYSLDIPFLHLVLSTLSLLLYAVPTSHNFPGAALGLRPLI